ncbi:MAG: hypothetical protein K2X28_05460 [Alphaproteobacteria bacterium]|nr:hypothetical protein [Alphaproteobacteria bacterium]
MNDINSLASSVHFSKRLEMDIWDVSTQISMLELNFKSLQIILVHRMAKD